MATHKPTLLYGDTEIAMPERQPWARTNGMYIAGRAYLDEADQTAAQMEAKWGCGRLRLLVAPELREKFDRQRYLLNQAVWHGELEAVRTQSSRMVKAYEFLDRTATEAGKRPLDSLVWETTTPDGTVIAIVPDNTHGHRVIADGRKVVVYSLDEVGRMLGSQNIVAAAKLVFPGATVTTVRKCVDDPLDDIHGSSPALDDEVPF